MKDRIEKRQEYARILAELDQESSTYGFLEKYGEEALEKADSVRSSDYESDVSPDTRGEGIVYKFLDKHGLLNQLTDNYYRVNFTAVFPIIRDLS